MRFGSFSLQSLQPQQPRSSSLSFLFSLPVFSPRLNMHSRAPRPPPHPPRDFWVRFGLLQKLAGVRLLWGLWVETLEAEMVPGASGAAGRR